jgi:hypothetical protein
VVVAIVIEEGAAELVGYAQFVMIDHFRADAFKIGFPHAVLVDAVLDVCRGSVHAAQHLVSVDTGVLVTGEQAELEARVFAQRVWI